MFVIANNEFGGETLVPQMGEAKASFFSFQSSETVSTNPIFLVRSLVLS